MRSMAVASYKFEFFDPTQPDMMVDGVSCPEVDGHAMRYIEYTPEPMNRVVFGVKVAEQVSPRYTKATRHNDGRWELS